MEHGDGNTRLSEGKSEQNQLAAKLDIIIQKHLQKPKMMSHMQLQKWHEEYKKADGDLMANDPIIEEVQSDELQQDAIGNCIAELTTEITVENRFCGNCRQLFDNWPDLSDPDVDNGINSYASWKHTVAQTFRTQILNAAARKGCQFCALVIQVMRQSKSLELFQRIESRLEWLNDRARASLSLENWGTSSSQTLWINLPGKICKAGFLSIASSTKFTSEAFGRDADTFDDQRDVSKITKDWITKCSDNHEHCKMGDQDILPTRLVYIGDEAPRLVLTAGWKTKPYYSTLSYAWGSSEFIKLKKETYESFFLMISFQELPKTFKDAIHISRQLGLEYIWIDALCIIQGDLEDWRQEASLMGSVYGGSYINIAASSAINVHEGCFLNAPDRLCGLRAPISVNGNTLVRSFRLMSVYSECTTESHLATRAWAMQEKILPCRTVHFGSLGAFWECRQAIASEFLPAWFGKESDIGLTNELDKKEYFGSWWKSLVILYSKANLTYGRDKLPALAGIAQSIHKERGGQYLAGIWREEDIETQLCWRVSKPQKRPSWRAPSWSWTSVDGETRYTVRDYNNPMENPYSHVLDAKMTCVDQNAFGEVHGGRLRIGCSGILAARFSGRRTIKIENVDDDDDDDYPVSPDWLDDVCWNGHGRVYLLPILGGTIQKECWDGDKRLMTQLMAEGILLSRKVDDRGDFYRIGKFQYSKFHEIGDRKEEEHYDSFRKAFEQEGASVAEGVCAEVIENSEYPEEKYVIHIV